MSEDKKESITDTPVVERNPAKSKEYKGTKLRDGERLLIGGKISNAIYWKSCAVVVLAFFFGLIAINLGVFLLIIAAIVAGSAFIVKKILFIVLTDQRVLIRRGVIKIDTLQLRLDSLESVEVQRTLVGQVLGYASVVITGVGNRFTIVPFVENAVEFRDALDDKLFTKDKESK